jgi:hypothetical protein
MATTTKQTTTVSAPQASMWDKQAAFDAIDRVGKDATTVRNNIQRIATIAIGYANLHGDISIAQRAVEVFQTNKGIRFNSFVSYLEHHGQLQWDAKAKQVVYRKRDDVIRDIPELVEALRASFWWEAIKAEEVVSMYDVKTAVEKLIAKATANAKKGGEVKHAEMLESLINLVEAHAE